MSQTEWIGVDVVAAEMGYTQRQAWEYVRRIGLLATNHSTMALARFTRADFEAARQRSLTALPRRTYSRVVATTPATAKARSSTGQTAAEALARLRNARPRIS